MQDAPNINCFVFALNALIFALNAPNIFYALYVFCLSAKCAAFSLFLRHLRPMFLFRRYALIVCLFGRVKVRDTAPGAGCSWAVSPPGG